MKIFSMTIFIHNVSVVPAIHRKKNILAENQKNILRWNWREFLFSPITNFYHQNCYLQTKYFKCVSVCMADFLRWPRQSVSEISGFIVENLKLTKIWNYFLRFAQECFCNNKNQRKLPCNFLNDDEKEETETLSNRTSKRSFILSNFDSYFLGLGCLNWH